MGIPTDTAESYTVLAVDDDPNIVNSIRTDLERAGFHGLVFEDDGHAIAWAIQQA